MPMLDTPRSMQTAAPNRTTRTYIGVSDLGALRTSACARRSISPKQATPKAELPSACRTGALSGEPRLPGVRPMEGGAAY